MPLDKRWLVEIGLLDPIDLPWRAAGMTASKFQEYAEETGLSCLSQEIINWNSRRLIDCISVFAKQISAWKRPSRIIRNRDFMKEARNAFMLSQLYSRSALSPQ
jgi:hypothetical protein